MQKMAILKAKIMDNEYKDITSSNQLYHEVNEEIGMSEIHSHSQVSSPTKSKPSRNSPKL